MKVWLGRSTVRTIRPGSTFDLTESTLDVLASLGRGDDDRRFLLTAVTHEFDSGDHLQLDSTQFQRMLDSSEPDIIFAMLLDKTSELVPKSDRGQFRVRLQGILATATRFSVRQTPDRLQFVVLSLATGESFHEHPGLEPTWRSIRERGASLGTEMKAWSEQLWLELDHGRRPAQ